MTSTPNRVSVSLIAGPARCPPKAVNFDSGVVANSRPGNCFSAHHIATASTTSFPDIIDICFIHYRFVLILGDSPLLMA